MNAEIKGLAQPHMEAIAEDVLDHMDRIAGAAQSKLSEGRRPASGALANINTVTSAEAIQKLDRIVTENRETYQTLANEPAIARVVVAAADDKLKTYYICRTTAIEGIPGLASYRSPVGSLASRPVGSEFELPNGDVVNIVERSRIKPVALPDGWDCRNTVIERDGAGRITIESLRRLLQSHFGQELGEDILAQILAEETATTNVFEGVRRTLITKMGLRDEPVLDEFQDTIFRLPLDSRLLLLGPPGTGKTTTLIRRLGQKLDTTALDERELGLINLISTAYGPIHGRSWLMFTPTKLLKLYLKEAFAHEGVAASEEHIKTWDDYRRELARTTFGILRTTSGAGTFVLKDTISSLLTETQTNCIAWYEDFNEWQRDVFIADLVEAAKHLQDLRDTNAQALGKAFNRVLNAAKTSSLPMLLETLTRHAYDIQVFVSTSRQATDDVIKTALATQLKRNHAFLDDLALFLDGLQMVNAGESEEVDDADGEDEEEATPVPKSGRGAAIVAFNRAIASYARSLSQRRSPSKASRSAKVIEWLGERLPALGILSDLGHALMALRYARRLGNPAKRYFDGLPKRYRSFRRVRQEESQWYHTSGFETRDLHPLELDVLLLATLSAGSAALSRPEIMRAINDNAWLPLQAFLGVYRNQILVDEATDFSPIQLACMSNLCHPRLKSFFACGDFNQRLTHWGARAAGDLTWIYPDLDIRHIAISYRQTQQLNALAFDIVKTLGGDVPIVSLPDYVNNDGVPPVLIENAGDMTNVADWLAERVRDIEALVGSVPSTAVFVSSEAEVAPVAAALGIALAEYNIEVSACHQGQVVGQEHDVRVFDIQHIKGLEFEAVFFIAVDYLCEREPDLLGKYLYVGTTRAATYLGLTSTGPLPTPLEKLRRHFASQWRD